MRTIAWSLMLVVCACDSGAPPSAPPPPPAPPVVIPIDAAPAPSPPPHVDPVVPVESLDSEVVERVVESSSGTFRACYKTALRQAPTLAGKLTIVARVDAAGTAHDVVVTGLSNQALLDCVHAAFVRLSFPHDHPGTLRIPMVLVSG
ncbi:MAG TPA: AgmX/PglI C-terminal domain-containing protein [Kofleriaceae bacterium]|jgi:hypothetical protein